MARSWTRACVVCSCRSRLAVRGSRCRPALSVGRRRDLAFGSLAPPSHREGRRAKRQQDDRRGRKRAGSRIASAPHKGTQSEIVTAGCGWWFLLAPAARHGAEEPRVEKRHQMMEGVPVCSKPISFTGRRWMQTRLTRPDSHELRRGASPQINAECGSKARQRQGRQRLVRIESPWVKSPWQIGRTRRSEAGVVKTQAPRADSEKRKHTGSGNHRSKVDDRNVIPSGTVEHGCTRVEFVDGSSLVVRISRV
jgi:hypothetical protein